MGTDDNVVELRQWYTVDELADREGVSTRTIYRRLKRGDVEKRETDDGTRYRPATDSTDNEGVSTDSHDAVSDVTTSTAPEGTGTATTDVSGVSAGVSTDSSGVSDLVDVVREQTDRIAELERKVGRLEADNERLRGDLEQLRDGDAGGPADEKTSGTSRAAELVDALRETADSN